MRSSPRLLFAMLRVVTPGLRLGVALIGIAFVAGSATGQTGAVGSINPVPVPGYGRVLPTVPTTFGSVTSTTTNLRMQIASGDLLEVSVFNAPELEQGTRVDQGGEASLNLIGPIHVAGLTTDQAGMLISSKLREGHFLRNPQVTVQIREYNTRGVAVLGEVARPGIYPVLGTRTVLDVISEAGGTTPLAAGEITVEREGSKEKISVALTNDANRAYAQDVELHPGDKVFVPHAAVVYVIGDVGKPGGFIMQNSGRMTVLQALALAEGVNHTAAAKQCRIIHATSSGYVDSPIELNKLMKGKIPDQQLQPEDIVFIPSSSAKLFAYRGLPSIVQAATNAVVYTLRP